MILADLIPADFYGLRSSPMLLLISGGAIVLLAFGADRAVGSAVRLARAMGMSTVIIGATVVSLGTTSPEAFVSVTAAFRGEPGLALGNGVGSMICDTALIFGLCCCIARLPKERFILNRHGWLQLGAGVLLSAIVAGLAVAAGGIVGVTIPRWVGVGLVVLLGGYLWVSVRWARQHPSMAVAEVQAVGGEAPAKAPLLGSLVLLAFGLGLVMVGSNLLVESAAELARRFGVPPSVLAVTLVAFGTSLPELVTAIASILKGHPELLVGNVIGADILNVLFVIGASATAVPLGVPVEFFYLHLPVMLIALTMLRLAIFARGDHFRRWHGVPLLMLFAGYYAALLMLARLGYLTIEGA